jgi:hypothetical protein
MSENIVQNDVSQKDSLPSKSNRKGGLQIAIGVSVGTLLILGPVVALWRVHTEYSITQNETLLIELGYNPAEFQYSSGYWIERIGFHVFGFAAIVLYIVFVASKRLSGSKVTFILCLVYFVMLAYSDITGLSEEQRIRGFTLGGWIGWTLSWLPKYVVELGLLVQGLLGVRKRIRGNRPSV